MTGPGDDAGEEHGTAFTDGRVSGGAPGELADLRTLLGPPYGRELAEWGGRGYADPTLIAGRRHPPYVLVMVLCLSAGADFVAVVPVFDLVLSSATQNMIMAVALGFIAVALYLAHTSGALFRDRRAGAASIGSFVPYLCVTVWLGLGIAAFEVRLRTLPPAAGLSFTSSPAPNESNAAYQTAVIFLALYVATGLVAGMGTYLWRNPLLDSYRSATRAYLKAHRTADMSSAQADSAEASLSVLRTELAAAEKTLEREIQSRRALAEKLKLTI